MTLQIIRKDGRIKGFAFFFGEARLLSFASPEREYWRICDCCQRREGLVFCRTHAIYICGPCLQRISPVHEGCEFISVSVARDIAQRAQKWAEVEA